MKKRVIALFSVILAGYVAFWSVTASHLKSSTQAFLEELNQLEGVSVHYDSIRVGEFPWQFGVTIRGAKFSFTGKGYLHLLKKINPKHPIAADTMKEVENLQNTMHFKDDIHFNSNLTGRHFTLQIGDIISTTFDKTAQVQVTQKGGAAVDVTLDRALLFSLLFNRLSDQFAATLVSDLQSVELKTKSTQYKVGDRVISSVGDGRVLFARKKLSKHQDEYRVVVSYQNVNLSRLMTLYVQKLPSYASLFQLAGIDPKIYESEKPSSLSFDIQAKMTPIPKLLEWYHLGDRGVDYILNAFQQQPPVFAVNHFKANNDLYCVDLTLHNQPNKKLGSDRVQLHAKFQLTERGQQFIAEGFAKGFANGYNPNSTPLEGALSVQAYEKIFPRLAEKGLIKLDMDYEKLADHSMNIFQYKVSCDPYSVALSGKIGPNTACNVMANIHNYQPLIRDIFDYASQVLFVLEHDKRFGIAVRYPDDFLQQIEQFVRKASDDPKSTSPDAEITINLDNAQLHVGTLSTAEVINEVGRLSDMVRITQKESAQTVFNQPVKPQLSSDDEILQQAIRHDLGQGTAIDYQKAAELYRTVIHDARAMNNLAVLLAQGRGGEQNVALAKEYFLKAAKYHSVARINLSNLSKQTGYPALIRSSGLYTYSVVCQQYDQQAIRNMIDVISTVGWREITLIPPGQPDAIPDALRAYTVEYAQNKGIRVHT